MSMEGYGALGAQCGNGTQRGGIGRSIGPQDAISTIPVSGVQAGIEQLSGQIDRLSQMVQMLGQRLDSGGVLAVGPPSSGKESPANNITVSRMSGAFRDAAERCSGIADHVSSIIDRLDI